MIPPWFIIIIIIIIICIGISEAQQSYDPHDCSSDTSYPGSRYTCNATVHHSCQTFLVYRATPTFQTASTIAALFNMSSDEVLRFNNFTSAKQILQPRREVLVPINCFCAGSFFQANFSYTVPGATTLTEVACGVYQGLLKSVTLAAQNPSRDDDLKVGTHLHVPLRCACPDNFTQVKYLVTYPFVEGDGTIGLSHKFGISPADLWAANGLEARPTVYPNTTVLVPLRNHPVISFTASDSPPPAPDFLPTVPVSRSTKVKNLRALYIVGSVVGFSLALIALLGCGFYVMVIKKQKQSGTNDNNNNVESPISCSTARSSPRSGQISSTNSCLSPDLLAGLKYSLNNYSTEEMRGATKEFSENNKISGRFFKGLVDNNVEVMIKQMRFEDTRQVIDMHSKINHINIVNLHGVCYGDSDDSCSYLVFELPANGCLRDCLSNASAPLPWNRRTQIAFDVATGLHYLHYCTFPTYAHMNVNTRSIFVTAQWRAKLANIGTTPAVGSSKGNDSYSCEAMEYLVSGSASEDIFAFGLVLLELISAMEDFDGMSLRGSIGFLGGEGEGGCFEQLKSLVDPCLKDDYPLAEALCLAVLARSCVEDDPLHRPSMDDIIKVLTRMVY